MTSSTDTTRRVVQKHLGAFLEDRGVDAILADYHDDAVFVTPDGIHNGRQAIRDFFTGFLSQLPEGTRDDFELLCLRTDDRLGFITWRVRGSVPLGTDTFVVQGGKIVQQTFAMHAA